MAEITTQMIKELRERTGVGMGKCKEALEESKGDMETAIANLRKAGMASAVKKEGRETKEGMISSSESSSTVAIVEVNAETDFVVKNERFQEFLKNIAGEVAKTNPANLETFLTQKYSQDGALTVDQYRATVVQTIGENIQIKRLKIYKKSPDLSIGVYSHLGGKLVTVVEIKGSNQEETLAKDIAMHVAASQPEYLAPKDIPTSILDQEKEIVKSQIAGKPANIVDKIVTGKLESFYDQSCLVRQKYIRDDSVSILELVQKRAKESGKPLELVSFTSWKVGQK